MDSVKFELKFTAEEVQLLATIRRIEEAANFTGSILALAPFIQLLSAPRPENVLVTVLTSDWEHLPTALTALEQVKACQIEKEIQMYVINRDGVWPDTEGTRLLQALLALYGQRCSA